MKRWTMTGAVTTAALSATLLVPAATTAPAQAATALTQTQLYQLRAQYYDKLTVIRTNIKAGVALITKELPAPYRAKLTSVTSASTVRIAAVAAELQAARTEAEYAAVAPKLDAELRLSVSFKRVAALAMDSFNARKSAIGKGQETTRKWLNGEISDEEYAPLAEASGRVAAIAAADLSKVWAYAGTASYAPASVSKRWTYALDGSVTVPETAGYTAIPGSCAVPSADLSWAGNAAEPGLHQWITDADVAANQERRKQGNDVNFALADKRLRNLSMSYMSLALSSPSNLNRITQRVGYNWLMDGDASSREWMISNAEEAIYAGPTGEPITDAAIMQGAVTALDWSAVGGEREKRVAAALRSLWSTRYNCMIVDRELWRDPANITLIYSSALFQTGIYLAKFDPSVGAAMAQASWTSMKPALDMLGDGGWFEGPTYWNLASGFLIGSVSTAQNVYAASGPATMPNLAPTAAFAWNATAPNGEIPPFGDAESENLRTSFPTLVARTQADPYAMAFVRRNLVKQPGALSPTLDRAYEIMWWPGAESWRLSDPQRTSSVYPLTGLASVQTPNATAWLRGTSRFLSHTHNDAGSFSLSAKGMEWVADPGKGNYGLFRYFDLATSSPRWTYEKVAASYHATVTGSADPRVSAAAPLTQLSPTSVKVDLTKKTPGATSATRTLDVASTSMTVTDRLAASAAQAWTWRWPTTATVTRGGTATSPVFVLSQGGQKVVVTVTGVPTGSTITVTPAVTATDTGAPVTTISITTPARTSAAFVAKATW